MWGSIGSAFGGSAASSAGSSLPWKGMSMGFGDKYSPSHKVFGNFFTIQDEYEDNRQLTQQGRLNQLSQASQLGLERASFEQRMALAREHGLHPLTMLGVPMSSAPMIGASSHDYQPGPGSGGGLDLRKHEPAGLSEAEKRMMEYNERIASANARDAEATAARNELQLMRESSIATGRPGSVSNDAQVLRQSALSGVPASRIQMGGSKAFAGSGDTALIAIKPDEINAARPDNPGLAAGVAPAFREVMGPDQKKILVPDQSVIQTEIDEGALYNSLINHGVSPSVALDIVGFKDIILTGLAGVAGVAGLGWRWRKARQAARIDAMAKKRRAWKGGE